jgi:hypothetical protein
LKVQEKISRIKRLIKKLKIENRDIESYRDDLYFCFYEVWSVKDWLINDLELSNKHPKIKLTVEDYINDNKFLGIAFDIANREKHLTLRNVRTGGEIAKSNIGVSINEHISVSIADVSVKLIHVDDLEEYDNSKKLKSYKHEDKNIKLPTHQTLTPAEITQDYTVQTNSGETFAAIYVIEKSLEAWESLICSLFDD